MEEKPNYFAIIPAEVRYDNDLRANEKLLFGEITALTQKTGECWASNKYFSELYGVQPNAVATWIRNLKNKNYIQVDYIYKGKEIEKRIIKIGIIQKDTTSYSKRYEGGIQKDNWGGIQKGEENNIKDINNTSINNNSSKKFSKPTIEDIQKYIDDNNLNVNANNFYDYYESNGWKVGHNSMKDWKATLRRWSRTNKADDKRPSWIDKEIKREEATDEELKELDRLLEDFK